MEINVIYAKQNLERTHNVKSLIKNKTEGMNNNIQIIKKEIDNQETDIINRVQLRRSRGYSTKKAKTEIYNKPISKNLLKKCLISAINSSETCLSENEENNEKIESIF